MNYDANDNFTVGGVPKTFAQFVAVLSTSDTIGGTYAPNPALVSTFNLTDTTPAVPTGVTPVATLSSVTVTFTAPAVPGDSYNVYRATTAAANCALVPAASYLVVGSATVPATGLTQTGLAAANYCYQVSTVLDGQESVLAPVPGAFVTVVSAATAPKSVYAAETVMGDGLANTLDFVTTGDVLTFVFDRAINAPAAGNIIQLRDADGTVVSVLNGAPNATFARNAGAVVVNGVSRPANTVLTTTMVSTPAAGQIVTAGTTAGLQYPATVIDESGITNGAVWNIAGSTDVTVEQ